MPGVIHQQRLERTGHRKPAPAGERGQSVVWTAAMLPLFLSVVGLSADGSTVFAARRELQNVADGAARAAAMQIDLGAYRDSGGTRVVLDTARARQTALAYLQRQGRGIAGTITTAPQQVVVRVELDLPLSFLPLFGIRTVRLIATAPAVVRYGVERPNT
jgi:hypothetical protein